jgi:hypothetical protein
VQKKNRAAVRRPVSEQVGYFIGSGQYALRRTALALGSADYGQTPLGHQDVAVSRWSQAAYDHVGQAAAHGHHGPGSRRNGHIQAGQGADFAGPGSGSTYHIITGSADFPAIGSADQDSSDPAGYYLYGNDFGKGMEPGSQGSCGSQEGGWNPPGVKAAIRDPDSTPGGLAQTRLPAAGFGNRDFPGWNPGLQTGFNKHRGVIGFVVIGGHEDATVVLDGLGDNAPEDKGLFHAFPGYGPVCHRIPGTRVQLAVVPAGGTRSKLTFFIQDD